MKLALGIGCGVWLALILRHRWKAASAVIDSRWDSANAMLVWDER